MIEDLLFGLGFVAVIEGLALALAPMRLRDALEGMRALPPEQLRLIGLLAATIGTALLWAARG
jgi:uncharacterized protein